MKSIKGRKFYSKILLLTFILLGIFFRFYDLDRMVYWYDEAFTSLRVSGHTRAEYIDEMFQGNAIATSDLQQYQQIVPEKTWQDTVNSLTEDVHPPLYFLLTRIWLQIFGDSITTTRSLTALLGVLAFPGLYWLCRELFRESSVAWVAVAVFAVSPFHILYAQEARMYSLFTVAIVVSSAALLKALRCNHKSDWFIYGLSLVLGFYSHLYFVFLAFSQVVYVAIYQGIQFTQTVRNFIITLGIASLSFLPWIIVVILNLDNVKKITSGAQESVAIAVLLKAWGANLGQVFIDVGLGSYFAPLILALAIYALYFLIRYASYPTGLFIALLIGVNAAVIILPDLILGGQGSARSRYFIPCYIGVEIAVAYLIVLKLESRRQLSQWLGIGLALLIFGGGLVSAIALSRSEVWWNKSHSRYNLEIARIINQAENPLIVGNTYSLNAIDFLALSHYLKPEVQFRLGNLSDRELQNLPSETTQFVYNPSSQLREQLEEYYQIQPINSRLKLLRLQPHATVSPTDSE
ncbi:MAG: glycosyltransferase family 39 protein [Spirulinaceae cyanobacterium]